MGVPSSDVNVFPGDFTIELWVKRLNPFHNNPFPRLFSLYTGTSSDIDAFAVSVENAFVYLWNPTQNPIAASTDPSVFWNAWVHVAVVRNGSSVVLYVNGAMAASAVVAGTIGSSTSSFFVGGLAYAYTNAGHPAYLSAWFGTVADFRVVQGVAVYT